MATTVTWIGSPRRARFAPSWGSIPPRPGCRSRRSSYRRARGCARRGGSGGRRRGLVGGKLAAAHGEGVVFFSLLSAQGGVGSRDHLAGGRGVAVALQSGAGIDIFGLLQARGVDKAVFWRHGDLRWGRRRKPFQGGDLADLGDILRFTETGDGFGGKPKKRDNEEVEKGEAGRDQHIAPLACLLGRIGQGHRHGGNLGSCQEADKAGSVARFRPRNRSTVT